MTLKILIITDGKMGDLVQCRGVANALPRDCDISEFVVQPNKLTSLPLPHIPLMGAQKRLFGDAVAQQDMIIASGRRTLPYIVAAKASRANPPFTVFLKDPRHSEKNIDFIWAPNHDGLSVEQAFQTDTSPHTLNKARLMEEKSSAQTRFGHLPAPYTGIILGGVSKSVTWPSDQIATFCSALRKLPKNQTVLITASRRTPDALTKEVLHTLKDHMVWYWDGNEENPYSQIIALSDQLVVTGDSHNMVSECLVAGVPVRVFRPSGLHPKLNSFLDKLFQLNQIHDLSFDKVVTSQIPIDSTPLIAAEIVKMFEKTTHARS